MPQQRVDQRGDEEQKDDPGQDAQEVGVDRARLGLHHRVCDKAREVDQRVGADGDPHIFKPHHDKARRE